MDVVYGTVEGGLVHVVNLPCSLDVLLELTIKGLLILLDRGTVLSIPLLHVFVKLLETVDIVIDGILEHLLSFSWGIYLFPILIDGHELSCGGVNYA